MVDCGNFQGREWRTWEDKERGQDQFSFFFFAIRSDITSFSGNVFQPGVMGLFEPEDDRLKKSIGETLFDFSRVYCFDFILFRKGNIGISPVYGCYFFFPFCSSFYVRGHSPCWPAGFSKAFSDPSTKLELA